MNNIRYSDDVKEGIALAQKLAKKKKQSTVPDRLYLKGLLLTHRKFTRLDALLTEMQAPADKLKQALAQVPPPEKLFNPTEDTLVRAEDLAKQTASNGHSQVLDVEQYLKALCYSSDPMVQQVLQENGITPEKIDQALPKIEQKKTWRSLLFLSKELVEVIGFVLFFLILIKSLLGELRLIPSESMVPGLQVEDRLVIERVSRWTRPYERGDILVFYPPMTQLGKDPWSIFLRLTGFSGLIYKKESNIDVAYIKRLIGLPGDTIDVKPGDGVYINGEMLDEPYVNEIANTCTIARPVLVCNQQGDQCATLPMTCGPVKIPSGHYFMMGDNRNMSLDSRYWGFASQERVIGRAVFRVWPLTRLGPLSPPPYQGQTSN